MLPPAFHRPLLPFQISSAGLLCFFFLFLFSPFCCGRNSPPFLPVTVNGLSTHHPTSHLLRIHRAIHHPLLRFRNSHQLTHTRLARTRSTRKRFLYLFVLRFFLQYFFFFFLFNLSRFGYIYFRLPSFSPPIFCFGELASRPSIHPSYSHIRVGFWHWLFFLFASLCLMLLADAIIEIEQ